MDYNSDEDVGNYSSEEDEADEVVRCIMQRQVTQKVYIMDREPTG
jgi:hypothetical protein